MGSEEKFDVIIVGGGPAGLTSAYFLAEAGFNVVVFERGKDLGSKNVYGGRIYAYFLRRVFSDYKDSAPIERWVNKEWFVILDEKRSLLLEYNMIESDNSFTAHLTKFVKWLGEKAENAGALVASGVKVDSLIVDDGWVKGVVADGERVFADYTIIAEGANTLLLEKSGLARKRKLHEIAVGVKEVFRLGEDIINTRFNVDSDSGVAALILGYPINEGVGGGFLYTMKNEVTLGVVIRLDTFGRGKLTSYDSVEKLRLHPFFGKLLKDGFLLEYSAHLIVEGGIRPERELYGNGYLVVGAAGGFELNTGFTVRGVDLAIESGKLAADAIIWANKVGSPSKRYLKKYIELLRESFLFREFNAFKRAPKFLSNERLYGVYPKLLLDFLGDIFRVEGKPKRLMQTLKRNMRGKVSMFTLFRDMIGAVRSL